MAEKSIRPEKVLRIIGLSLFGVAILLAFIGCFGDIVARTLSTSRTGELTITTTTSNPFTYLFSDMWKALDNVKAEPHYTFQLLLSLLALITYIGCATGVLTIVIVTLVKFVSKPGTEGVDVKKLSKLLAISVVPFLISIMMLFFAGSHSEYHDSYESYTSTSDLTTSFGWGTILMIVGAMIGLVAGAFSSIKDNADKNDIVRTILTRASTIILVFIAVFGFRSAASVVTHSSEYSQTMEYNYGIFMLVAQCFQKYSPSGETMVGFPGARTLAVFAFIFAIAALCFIILAIKSKKTGSKIAFIASLLGCSILVGALSQAAIGQVISTLHSNETARFGGGALVTAILSGIALIITCVSTKFATPEKAKVETKKAIEKK